jgi:hypothetical protein
MYAVSNLSSHAQATTRRSFDANAAAEDLSTSQRRDRLYESIGGPLMAWLYEEAETRGHDSHAMAHAIGSTPGYLNALRNGHKKTESIGQATIERMAAYLGVPPVVVKIVGGSLPASDFACAAQGDAELLNRTMKRIERDPVVRPMLRTSLTELPDTAQRVIAAMYGEISGRDVFAHCQIPEIVRHLQRASAIHLQAMREAGQLEEKH